MNVEKANVSLATFNTAYVRTMKPADVCESFLAQARTLTKHSKRKAE